MRRPPAAYGAAYERAPYPDRGGYERAPYPDRGGYGGEYDRSGYGAPVATGYERGADPYGYGARDAYARDPYAGYEGYEAAAPAYGAYDRAAPAAYGGAPAPAYDRAPYPDRGGYAPERGAAYSRGYGRAPAGPDREYSAPRYGGAAARPGPYDRAAPPPAARGP